MQRVIMLGNCQIQSMHGLYLRFAEQARGQQIRYIRSYEDISAENRAAIESADLIVEQMQDFKPKADIAGIATHARRILVPVVHGGFLWPFAGQRHPGIPQPAYGEPDPYGAEASDAWLNRMYKKGVNAETAVAQYETLDVNATVNLERLYEMVMDKQRLRDEMSGFRIADLIEEHFRTEAVFRTPYHPNRRIAVALATQFFQKLGVTNDDIRRMQRATRITPFPKEELPLHPSVIKHYGLRYADESTRYQFLNEGSFTFREYALRYMNLIWNKPLQLALRGTRELPPEMTHELLVTGLEQSPNSAAGLSALAHVLESQGELTEATAPCRRAIDHDPENAHYRAQFGVLLTKLDDTLGAEHQFRIAAALEPFDSHFPCLLANFLGRHGHQDEAIGVLRQSLVCNPQAVNLLAELGYLLVQKSYAKSEAEAVLRQALELDALHNGALHTLAKLMCDSGHADEAGALWCRVLQLEPSNLHAITQWVETLLRQGKAVEAEVIVNEALLRSANSGSLKILKSRVLKALGRLEEAIGEARQAVTAEVGNGHIHSQLADLLVDAKEWSAAEQELRKAIALGHQSGHVQFQLSVVLIALGRLAEAVAARQVAAETDPDNVFRLLQLGQILLLVKDESGAEIAMRRAALLGPKVFAVHHEFSHLLLKLGRLDEAHAAARHAASIEPNNLGIWNHLINLCEHRGDLSGVEEGFHAILKLQPGNTQAIRGLERLAKRQTTI